MDKKFSKKIEAFKNEMLNAFGNSIRKPISARLGVVDEDGNYIVKVPDEQSDEPNEYFFSEIGSTSYKGKAQLKTGTIPYQYLRYGTPIRVIRDILSNRWEIIGVDNTYFQQYYSGVSIEETTLYSYSQLAMGLLRATTPPSMQIVVLQASYNVGNQWKYIDNLFSVDWSQAPNDAYIPSTSGKQRFVLVSISFDTESLTYEYGDEHDIGITLQMAMLTDAANNNSALVPIPDSSTNFRSGYIRLYNNQSIIQDKIDVFPMQDYLSKVGAVSYDNIVTANNEVVIANGNVVHVE